MKSIRFTSALLATLCFGSSAMAEVIPIDTSGDLIAAVAALQPGDELVLAGGTYELQSKFTISVEGSETEPIVIRAADGEAPVITRPDAGQNTVNIEFSEYLELRGLEIFGGSHGIRIRESSFITIEDCEVRDTADVAISANFSGSAYEGLVFRGNHIHDTGGTGEGMYLGCNDNACQMFNSLIEGNYIHHTNGSTVVQGDGIEIKEGSYNNTVRDNVIHDTNYPCLLTYSTVGNGGPNVIEGNVMWNCGDHAIQSAADAVIRNNIILGASQDGIRGQKHQAGQPSNLHIINNTIIKADKDAIRIGDINGEVVIANNAIFAQSGSAIRVAGDLSGLVVTNNAGSGGLQGIASGFDASGALATDLVDANYGGGVPNDVFPTPDSVLNGAADSAYLPADDFNGMPRSSNDVGAYAFDADGNPGWALGEDFKDLPDAPTSGSGGQGGSATTGAGAGATAGAGGSSNAAGSGGAGAGDASNTADTEESSGCSVSAAGRPAPTWLLFALLWLGVRRRCPER